MGTPATAAAPALQGRLIRVRAPRVYAQPASQWQPRLVGHARRVGLSFGLDQAWGWLRDQGIALVRHSSAAQEEDLRDLARLLQEFGLIRYETDLLLHPLAGPGVFVWPVIAETQGGHAALDAYCLICREWQVDWVRHDPATESCICRTYWQRAHQ